MRDGAALVGLSVGTARFWCETKKETRTKSTSRASETESDLFAPTNRELSHDLPIMTAEADYHSRTIGRQKLSHRAHAVDLAPGPDVVITVAKPTIAYKIFTLVADKLAV